MKPLLHLRLPPTTGAPGEARRSLGALASRVEHEAFERVQLLLSETVTNAVRQGSGDGHAPIDVTVEVGARRVRVEVRDAGEGIDPLRLGPDAADQGRRWERVLLERLADRWGTSGEGGSLVWFEVSDPTPQPA